MPLEHVRGAIGGLSGPSLPGGGLVQPPRLFGGPRPSLYYVAPVGRRQVQGAKSSCVAHGFSKPMENEALARGRTVQVCRADLYSGALAYDGSTGRDVGVTLRSMARMVARGVLSEWERPYGSDDVTLPTSPALEIRRTKGVLPVEIPLTVDAIQDALLVSGGVPYGHAVHANYTPDAHGVLPPPAGALEGYHCTYLAGWDDALGLLMEQSWAAWGVDHPLAAVDNRFAHLAGKRGYCWVPYAWVTSGGMFEPYLMRGALEVA